MTASAQDLAIGRLVKRLNQQEPGIWSDTVDGWLCRTCDALLTSTDIEEAGACTQCGTKIRKD